MFYLSIALNLAACFGHATIKLTVFISGYVFYSFNSKRASRGGLESATRFQDSKGKRVVVTFKNIFPQTYFLLRSFLIEENIIYCYTVTIANALYVYSKSVVCFRHT